MGIPVLVLGESGSGKTCSLRNFNPSEIGVLSVSGKPLPFKTDIKTIHTRDYSTIEGVLRRANLNAYAIDDSQYLLCFDLFDKAKEVGYEKFTNMAVSFYRLIQTVINQTPDSEIVYFLHHTQTTEDGHIKAKTIGRMLDEKLTLEGMFSVVLLCTTDGQHHQFVTQSDGFTTAKSPLDMFPLTMDNDLRAVDTAIREYWGLNQLNQPTPKTELKNVADAPINNKKEKK